MSKKTLNTENLTALGAQRLADLLMEVSMGSAEIKRRLRLELSHNLGVDELVHDVRKRLTSIGNSKSFVSWRKRKSLIKELETQISMIVDKISVEAPSEAFDLLWQFLELAPSLETRVDDRRGDVSEVFRAALSQFEQIAPRAIQDPKALADRVWEAVRAGENSAFDGIITLVAPTLGEAGLDHLRDLVTTHADAPLDDQSETHEAIQFLRELRSTTGNYAAEQRARLITRILQEIAEVQGDTDAYLAQYSDDDLLHPNIAAEAANLLLSEGRTEEALHLLTGADLSGDASEQDDWDTAYVACLTALDRVDEAQTHRWACFTETLNERHLREYLRGLPDFDDIDGEDRAKTHALQFANMSMALRFFVNWRDASSAAQLVESRAGELDGDLAYILTPAAEALRDRHPLAAVLIWRAMIERILEQERHVQYGLAADHLMDCTAQIGVIGDYGRFASHQEFLEDLQARHGRASSFWQKVTYT